MVKKDFISSILKCNVDHIEKKVKAKVRKQFLNNPKWNIKRIYSAYGAAGALAEWLES